MQRYPLEDEGGLQSQSADCEPPPPPPHGSYTNLFDTSNDVPLGGSAHSMQRLPGNGTHPITGAPLYTEMLPGRSVNAPVPPPRSIQGGRISPGHQRITTAPMAVPDQFSPSDPSPANMYPGGVQQKMAYVPVRNSPSAEHSLASDAKYPTTQALITDKGKTVPNMAPASQPVGAKRSTSQGSLNKQSRGTRTTTTAAAPATTSELPRYSQNHINGSGDNIPITATANNSAAPPPPHKVQTVVKYKESGYSSSSTSASSNTPLTDARGGPVTTTTTTRHHNPHAPPVTSVRALQEIDNVPGAVRRPMSFVKAVELSDAIASQEREREKQIQKHHGHSRPPASQPPNLGTTNEERHNMYGSTYEISV